MVTGRDLRYNEVNTSCAKGACMEQKKMKVALIGSGMISGIYLKNLQKFDATELVGCSDIIPARAEARAAEFGIRAMTNEEIFADPSIELVVNTTYPTAHYAVARQALAAGKHVYTEKMVCETLAQANELQDMAAARGLFCGGAPDTYLGGGAQLARMFIDAGMIGTPTMAEAFLSRSYHHERFHTAPEKRFAFCRHGGIIFDMGAYYLTELVFLLGPISRVTGFSQTRDPDRTFSNPNSPLFGQPMTVETPNNTTGVLAFAGGALGTLTMTSEGGASANRFVIHGTDGYIDLGDPNNYDGTITVKPKKGDASVIHTPFAFHGDNFRGLGVADAIYAIRGSRAPRCSGELTRHVLEAALGICQSSDTGMTYAMTTTCTRPAPFAVGYTEYPELVLSI